MAKSIKFSSIINHNGDETKISFKAPVTIGEFKEFKSYDFIEPENKVANKIEVSDNKVNIFAGASTIELELDKVVSIKYKIPEGMLFLDTHMTELKNKNQEKIEFKYSLSQNGEILGNYHITLEIKG
ncbi:MAG: DUF1934 domain-containing protein [Mycoplasma sp.]|nr:DUF1934 domain-containing protein [Mycoplasma sp.]